MKPPFAHLSPTLLALAAAIAVSLSVFLMSGAGLQGAPIPLLPALGGAAGSVAVDLATRAQARASAPARTTVSSAKRVPVSTTHVRAPRPAAHRVHRANHARARVVRHAPPSPLHIAVSAPAPTTPAAAPQVISVPKGKAKAHGHRHGQAGKPSADAGAPRHGNGRALGPFPEHHQGLPPGQAKKVPAAPPKGKGGGPPADHGGDNGHKGDKK
jgi:hypothetical protein